MRKLCLAIAGSFFLFGAFCGAAQATTYYVDASVSSSGSGQSWATAWKSVSNISGLTAGDTVYFSGGSSGQTYSVSNWTPSAGTSSNPITYAVGQDAGHNGMVTFSGSGNFVNGNLTGVTINGGVSGNIRMTVGSSYDWTIYSDGGNTNGFKLLHVNFTAPIWGRGTGYEIGWCHGVSPLSMMDDSYIAHIGENSSGHTSNLIHDNYFQVWRIRNFGYGQDILKWVGAASIYNNTFISAYNANYTGNQHGDGIQTSGNDLWIYNNYFEGMISYPIYDDMFGSTSGWRIYNNVINSNVADAGSIDWGAYQCMALGAEASGITISDYIVANNTCIGNGQGTGQNGIHFNTGTPASVGPGCYLVNNIVYNSNTIVYYNGGATVSNNVGGTSNIAFVNNTAYPNGDFHLKSTATAVIGKGISPSYLTNVFTTDKDGNQRPNGSWDIGAYQYASGTSASGPTPPTGLAAMVQ